jgi:hypothetical protein
LWSGHNYATMALVLPGSNALLKQWQQQHQLLSAKHDSTNDPKKRESINLALEVADLLIAGLKRRFGPQDFASDDNQPFLIASYLHPTYKNLMFVPESNRNRVIGHVKTWIRGQLEERFEGDNKQPNPVDKVDQVRQPPPVPDSSC